MVMKVRVDPVKCEGFGPCHDLLPEVFLLDEWGYAHTEKDGEVPPGREEDARQAAANCPVHAIVVDEGGA
jgi:ferredoxin